MEKSLFPEDELLRHPLAGGFRLKARPARGDPLWQHGSGTLHTHKDAVEFVLHGFGYHRDCTDGYWVDVTGAKYRLSEVVTAVRLYLEHANEHVRDSDTASSAARPEGL